MRVNAAAVIETVIDYIENHLDGKLELETAAEAVHYSKYHLHRLFNETVGMTIHDYVQRRQLTEAAKLLVFSDRPVIEIAFICGYESQQSFTSAFKSMYKSPPAQYRAKRSFYPLQLRFTLQTNAAGKRFAVQDIHMAEKDPSFPDQSMYHTFWLHTCADGDCLVCSHADIQRYMGGCFYSLLLSAAVSHFVFGRSVGGPIPEKKTDHRRGSIHCISYVSNGSGSPAYISRAGSACRTAGDVGCPLSGRRYTDSRR